MLNRVINRILPRLPNYIKSFGVWHGLVLAIKLEGTTISNRSIFECRTPYLKRSVYLRDDTGDRSIYWQCIVRRQYDLSHFKHHYKALRRKYEFLLKNGLAPLIIDGGANIGLASVYFHHVFPDARIVAVEPDRENFELLERNSSNFKDQCVLVCGALWPHDAWVKITNPEGGSTAFIVSEVPSAAEGAVPAIAIDTLLARENANEAFVVKLDIEGAQRYLFDERARSWIARTDCVILELDDWLFPWEGTSTNFFIEMSKHQFDYILHGEHIVCFNHRLAAEV